MTDLRVVKLGGSLLELADWPERLVSWLAAQPSARNALIVGGGELANVIRRYDARFELGEAAAHWLCIRVLGVHAQMAAEVLAPRTGRVMPVRILGELAGLAAGDVAVFDPEPFLLYEEPRLAGTLLPHTWRVTTDSIAARVAQCAAAAELVLLKSTPPPEFPTDAALGYVDEHFAAASQSLRRVRYVDLRAVEALGTTQSLSEKNCREFEL
jgi:aspartokinase-like uncharacterized kinase